MTLIGLPVLPGGQKQIGLAAEKGGDLQDIHDFGDRRALRRFVNVGDHRQAGLGANFGEDRQRGIEAHAASRGDRGTVGLVERGFVDEADLRACRPFP